MTCLISYDRDDYNPILFFYHIEVENFKNNLHECVINTYRSKNHF